MRSLIGVICVVALMVVAGCAGSGSETAAADPTDVPAATAAPLTSPTETPLELPTAVVVATSEPGDVPFPEPRNLVDWDVVVADLRRPPGLADLYELTEIDDFTIYEDASGQILLTEGFMKQGFTFGYVTTLLDGQRQSSAMPVSNELAGCVADTLAESLPRFEAELVARGLGSDPGSDLLDLYLRCEGLDELITGFRDDIYLGQEPFDITCVETRVTTAEHLRTLSQPDSDFQNEAFIGLMSPCLTWTLLPIELSGSSVACLDPAKPDALRAVTGGDVDGFYTILKSCLTADELAQIPG